MCEAHEGEVKVLWKGARSAAGEAGDGRLSLHSIAVVRAEGTKPQTS